MAPNHVIFPISAGIFNFFFALLIKVNKFTFGKFGHLAISNSNGFPSSVFSVIHYGLFRTLAISNGFLFPLRARNLWGICEQECYCTGLVSEK